MYTPSHYAPKLEKYPVQYWDSVLTLLVHPSRAQTSEILWQTLRIHDLEHSEWDVYASFKWDVCSNRVITKSGMPKAWLAEKQWWSTTKWRADLELNVCQTDVFFRKSLKIYFLNNLCKKRRAIMYNVHTILLVPMYHCIQCM